MPQPPPVPADHPQAPATPPAARGPDADQPGGPPAHHVVIVAAAAFLLGRDAAITSIRAVSAPPPAHPAPPRPGRPGVWSRVLRSLTGARRAEHPRRARTTPPHPATPGHVTRTPMKLKVTVEGKTYEVEVEAIDGPGLGSAALRVEGSPVGPPAAKPGNNRAGAHKPAPADPAPVTTPTPVTPAPAATIAATPAKAPPPPPPRRAPEPLPPHQPPGPWPDRAPWHGLSVGNPGECVAPIPGVIASVLVKAGDVVKANDPLIQLEASHVVSPQDKPLIGTVRAVDAGTVSEVVVNPGDTVAFGQLLVRLSPSA